jgi:hypothetical protein
MIGSAEEYRFAVDALQILKDRAAAMRKHYQSAGYDGEELKRLTDPHACILAQRQEEIDEWEKAHPPEVAAPAESDYDRFERLADEFYRATGYMAPGKDDRSNSHTYEERRNRWDEWISARQKAAAPAEECTDCLGIGEHIEICIHCGRNYAKERAEKDKL